MMKKLVFLTNKSISQNKISNKLKMKKPFLLRDLKKTKMNQNKNAMNQKSKLKK